MCIRDSRCAELEIFPAYAAGLRDLDGFEYLILLTYMHHATEEPLDVVPFLDTVSHGVFATRAPSRPNRMGLSIVRLVSICGTVLHFEGNDMVDGTPIPVSYTHLDVYKRQTLVYAAKDELHNQAVVLKHVLDRGA